MTIAIHFTNVTMFVENQKKRRKCLILISYIRLFGFYNRRQGKRLNLSLTRIVAITAAALLLSACRGAGGGSAPDLTSITITPNPGLSGIGYSRQLIATGTLSDGTTANVSQLANWTTGDK